MTVKGISTQFAGRVELFLRVDEFDAAYLACWPREWFISQPRDEPYGRLAVFLHLEDRWDLADTREPRKGLVRLARVRGPLRVPKTCRTGRQDC